MSDAFDRSPAAAEMTLASARISINGFAKREKNLNERTAPFAYERLVGPPLPQAIQRVTRG